MSHGPELKTIARFCVMSSGLDFYGINFSRQAERFWNLAPNSESCDISIIAATFKQMLNKYIFRYSQQQLPSRRASETFIVITVLDLLAYLLPAYVASDLSWNSAQHNTSQLE